MEENGSVKSGASSMMPSSASAMDVSAVSGGGGGEDAFNGATVPIRIYVPELNVQKVIHFHRDELVWNVKQQCLATLPKVSHAPSLFFIHSPVPWRGIGYETGLVAPKITHVRAIIVITVTLRGLFRHYFRGSRLTSLGPSSD